MITDRTQINNKLIMPTHHKTFGKLSYFSLLWLLACLTITTTATSAQSTANEVKGDGLYPAPLIPGDVTAPPSVPSGLPSNWLGSNFPHTTGKNPLIIYLRTNTYSHNTHESMGVRTVLTINPSTIHNPMTLDLIAGVLQLDLSSAQTQAQNAIWLDVSKQQLEQLQQIMAPSANDLSSITTQDANNRTYIYQDPSTSNVVSSEPWLLTHLPIVKQFSRYAVLLGVILATVLFSLAAYGLTMGERSSGQRIIGTAAGLIILLMAFTIYRLLINHTINSSVSANTSQVTQ